MNLNIVKKIKSDADLLETPAQIFKILAHPARIAILNILRDGEHCVCHMEAYLGLRQAYISQQLAVLREAGLIQDRRDGWNVFYRVVNPDIYTVLEAAQKFVGQETDAAPAPLVSCNCPHCAAKTGNP